MAAAVATATSADRPGRWVITGIVRVASRSPQPSRQPMRSTSRPDGSLTTVGLDHHVRLRLPTAAKEAPHK